MNKNIALALLALIIGVFSVFAYQDLQSENSLLAAARWSKKQETPSHLTSAQEGTLVDWIESLQYQDSSLDSYGAITVSDGIAVYENGTGTPMKRVTPYFSHLAVLGVLDSSDRNKKKVAERWIDWYLSHIDAGVGVPLDTWYSVDGSDSSTCPIESDSRQCLTVDAEDSSAALFLVVVNEYLNQGGSSRFVKNRKDAIRDVTDTLTALVDSSDGLSWAKETYRVKYLMDNVEVFTGLNAALRLESQYFKSSSRKNALTQLVIKANEGIYGASDGSLYSSSSSLYYVYKDEAGVLGTSNMSTWYPDLMAELWPVVFEQTGNASSYNAATAVLSSNTQVGTLESGDCAALAVQTGGVHEPVLAYAMRKQNHAGGVAMTSCMYEATTPTFAWPFNAASAGWLLRK